MTIDNAGIDVTDRNRAEESRRMAAAALEAIAEAVVIPNHYVAILADITEQKNAQEVLRQARHAALEDALTQALAARPTENVSPCGS